MKWALTASALVFLQARPSRAGETPATFTHDIAPIVFKSCAPCHRPGEAGPFALLTYDDVKKHARQIATVTASRYMPPWLPQAGYGEFAGERRLTDGQIHLIAAWVKAGAPEGPAAGMPSPPRFAPGWQLGTPDLVVEAKRPYTTPAGGRDVFWNFVLSPDVKTTRYVKAIEIRPGNRRIVHHANMLVDRTHSSRREEKSPGAGFPGMDLTIEAGAFDPDSHFLFWKPGSVPSAESDGLAWRLDPGDDLVLNVHLQPSGKPEEVRPSVGLYFTDRPQAKFPMLVQLEHDGALDIPPGAADFLVTDDFRLPVDADALAVYPHAHYLGKLLEGYATLPDGRREWLVRIPDWDLNWQAVYQYRRPVFLPKGTLISMRFHYDNSGSNPRNPHRPAVRVRGGNQSTDEMGHLWLQLLPRGEGDQRAALQEAAMRRRLEKYPADFSAHFNLGALMLSRKRPDAAIEYLREALRAEPEQPAALNALGAAFETESKFAEAEGEFRHALRVQPEYTSARYNLANALAAQGNLEAAEEEFRRVVAAAPEDKAARDRFVEALKETGGAAERAGNLEGAAKRYAELVKLAPGDAGVRNSYGVVLARTGAFAAAAEQFAAAVKSDPSNEVARRNLELARQRMPERAK